MPVIAEVVTFNYKDSIFPIHQIAITLCYIIDILINSIVYDFYPSEW